jgi:hypothetical protein
VVATELVQQAPVVGVHQPTRSQMSRHRRLERSSTRLKSPELAPVVVILMPQFEPFLQQLLEPGTEMAGTPLLGLQHPPP